jgi:hypothetical protein
MVIMVLARRPGYLVQHQCRFDVLHQLHELHGSASHSDLKILLPYSGDILLR